MLASAVSSSDWKDAIKESRLGEIFETPLDFLFNTCMRRALESRRRDAPEQVVVTFDARDPNLKFWDDLAKGYERRWSHKVAGYAFSSMEKVLPLQAADMVAYEVFLHEIDRSKHGGEPNPRPNMSNLLAHLAMYGGHFPKENLIEYAQKFFADKSG